MKAKIKNRLIKLADKLDRGGMIDDAAVVDDILASLMPYLEGARIPLEMNEDGSDAGCVGKELDEYYSEYSNPEVGDMVEDRDPECPHYGSLGIVTKVGKKKKDEQEVTYLVINEGENYSKGDELTMSVNALAPLDLV